MTLRRTVFVLGGGGLLGASEVGMLRALIEAGIRPDLVVGTSIGAMNAAMLAADPSTAGIGRLLRLWLEVDESGVFSGSLFGRVRNLARSGTHLHPNEPLRELLTESLPVQRIEDLPVAFQCVAASIERAAEHWFAEGDLVEAVLASAATPGLLPPVEIDGEHFFDGGLLNSIPVDRAVALGATEVYVLQVGRIEEPLQPPTRPWEVALVAFEIARRHRFAGEMAALPDTVTAHVLPTGDPVAASLSQLRYRDTARVGERVELAYAAARAYLARSAEAGT
ncbi:MAG: patatin-like phospholipase family protein [Nitriliruptorales bacterium]|nr:patatin-like phospholipase family protein [Nitriliruptorales bacterium]